MAWDYIIVGAGSAGCVLAHRLSAERKNKVLLLEGGGFDTSPVLRVPAGEIKAILNPRFNWMYMSEPDPSLNGRDAIWPGGKVLGGSSSINGMIYLRGQHEDYDGWARLIGNTGAWSYRDVLPYFKRMESNPLGPSEYHGADGPLRVSDVPTPHPLGRVFVEAAKELGIPFNADVNGERQEGAGPNQGTVRFGRRNSTARAYLRPVMGRRNLDVETEARVDKVLFEEGRARAVVYSRAGVTHEARADGEIILSAGAIASPAILLRSGIGPAADLSQLGIPVVADSPGVGNNLQEHPAAWVAAMSTSAPTTPRSRRRATCGTASIGCCAARGRRQAPSPSRWPSSAPGRRRRTAPTSRSTSCRPATSSARTGSSCWSAPVSPSRSMSAARRAAAGSRSDQPIPTSRRASSRTSWATRTTCGG